MGGFFPEASDHNPQTANSEGISKSLITTKGLRNVSLLQLQNFHANSSAQVRVFAFIISVQTSATSLNYILEDSTSIFTAKLYDQASYKSFEYKNVLILRIGDFVCIAGALKQNSTSTMIVIAQIEKIQNFDSFINHFLWICSDLKIGMKKGATQSLKSSVLNFYQAEEGPKLGHSDNDVCKAFEQSHLRESILHAIKDLENKGLIYRTIDDSHHKSTKYI